MLSSDARDAGHYNIKTQNKNCEIFKTQNAMQLVEPKISIQKLIQRFGTESHFSSPFSIDHSLILMNRRN